MHLQRTRASSEALSRMRVSTENNDQPSIQPESENLIMPERRCARGAGLALSRPPIAGVRCVVANSTCARLEVECTHARAGFFVRDSRLSVGRFADLLFYWQAGMRRVQTCSLGAEDRARLAEMNVREAV